MTTPEELMRLIQETVAPGNASLSVKIRFVSDAMAQSFADNLPDDVACTALYGSNYVTILF